MQKWIKTTILSILIISALISPLLASNRIDEKEELPNKNPLLEAIKIETLNIKYLKEDLRSMARSKASIYTEIDSYKLQNNAFSGFLFSPKFSFNKLEEAIHITRQTIEKIKKHSTKINEKNQNLREKLKTTQKKYNLILDQIENIEAIAFPINKNKELITSAKKLENLLLEKQKIIENLTIQNNNIVIKLANTESLIKSTLEQLEASNKFNERKIIFKKENFDNINACSIFLDSFSKIKKILSSNFWLKEFENILQSGFWNLFVSITIFVFIFSLAIFFFKKCNSTIISNKNLTDLVWHETAAVILIKSLFLTSFLLWIYSINALNISIYRPFYVYSLAKLLLICQILKWFASFIKLKVSILEKNLLPLIKKILLFCIFYTIISFLFLDNLALIFFMRLFGQFFFFVSIINLFKKTNTNLNKKTIVLKIVSMAIIAVGIFIDLNGFAILSEYWYFNCFKVSAVILWSYLLFMSYKETAFLMLKKHKIDTNSLIQRWFLTSNPVLLFLWGILSLLVAFGACFKFSKIFLLGSNLLSFKFTLGEINISFAQVVFSILNLFLTKIIIELSKNIFDRKISKHIVLNKGLKNSIITINVYILWSIGFLISLSLLGVSATSMIVAFGALGIGLGFGMQNIFNNFVCGIILLFERPIEVGDYVEIGGIWGKIKKINVRATIVQSFDNASLIIPNSEFVNSQVTNWSFKDKRVRRNIKIGVSYSSDVKKVQSLLLDIVTQIEKILKIPAPSVLFSEYEDSALLFTLRYWTTVDYGFTTETEVRCKINSAFKENNITISFPQRDIHIRNLPPIFPNK